MDATYLKETVGVVLQKALVKTVVASPNDPIEHLAALLRAEANTIEKQVKIDAELKEETDAVAEQQRAIEETARKAAEEKRALEEARRAAQQAKITEFLAEADKLDFSYASMSTRFPSTIGMYGFAIEQPGAGSAGLNAEMLEKIKSPGFIAALDQSGGSTPKTLAAYGIEENSWADEAEMHDMVHAMRSRIVMCPKFNGERVIAAILFEATMDREFDGMPAPSYLWEKKQVVPLLKCDKGLADEENGCQVMKEIEGLEETLERAAKLGVFGTKMRSRIAAANADGINAVVAQQFEVAKRIIAAGLCPIIEPEVDISIEDKADAEKLLLEAITTELDKLEPSELVMLKLTIPSEENLYTPCINHPNVVRVVALSGGYPREEACEKLKTNTGMIASFSRALMEGITQGMSDEEFEGSLDKAIQSIFDAST